jgi:CheY-like chemotaxis protein
MKNKKDIIIIDDEEVILDAICKIAAFENFTCEKFISAKAALEKLEKYNPRLIISDIMMPDLDGFELLDILRKQHISTPVVITTGFSTLENAVKALYDGALAFIPKPFSVEEMTSIIKRGIEYGNIFSAKESVGIHERRVSQNFVPCPPKYHRLGYDSWINDDVEGLISVGVTDLFLKSIGMINEIEFMKIDDEIFQGGNCLKLIDSEEYTHQLLSPISGKIIDINEKVVVNKSLMEKDPYFNGWIYKILPNNFEVELSNLTPCSSDS